MAALYHEIAKRLSEHEIELRFADTPGDERGLSRAEVLRLWREDTGFCGVFSDALAKAPFDAFFWETPAWTRASLDQPFVCVLVDAPGLATALANSTPFKTPLSGAAASREVVSFKNLGGDAELVVPRDLEDGASYAHLAGFLRTAGPLQVRALWREVGLATDAWVNETGSPVWLSTSGLGVPWLHVRLDARPKYYTHTAYRQA
ncbi:MAG: hypothetical protein JWP35_4772 [Caulobacter sp.]|nr:hypothetical protein [Caulobacter sp.]